MTSDPATRAQPESPSKTTSVRISNVHLVDIVTLFALGIFVGSGLCFARLATGYFSIATYLGLLSLFHAMEFLVTAAYQPSKVSFDSFLLNNSSEYATAITAALGEYMIESYLFPRLKSWLCIFRFIGFLMAVTGQIIRSAAMIEARDAFSHQIAEKKQPSHSLVTSGIYGVMRHPSYTGFFLWSLGTQLVLGNPVCLAGFYHILNNFFQERIRYEEETLSRFFAAEYTRYKASTWSGFFNIA